MMSRLFLVGCILAAKLSLAADIDAFDGYDKVFRRIPEEIWIQRRNGVESLLRDEPEEVKSRVRAWLAAAFGDPELWPPVNGAGFGTPERLNALIGRLEATSDPFIQGNQICQGFLEEMRKKESLASSLRHPLFRSGLEYCERTWADARTPADLATAVQTLQFLKAADSARWMACVSGYNPEVEEWMPGPLASDRKSTEWVKTAYDYWLVLASGHPLILPDPATETRKAREVCDTFDELNEIRNRFVARPLVAKKAAELRWRLMEEEAKLRNQLDDLVIANASAGEFEKVLARYGRTDVFSESRSSDDHPYFDAPHGLAKDYREVLALRYEQLVKEKRAPKGAKVPSLRFYQAWLAARYIEEGRRLAVQGTPQVSATMTEASWRVLSHLLFRNSKGVSRNLETSTSPTVLPSAKKTAIERFEELLVSRKELSAWAKVWQELKEDSPKVSTPSANIGYVQFPGWEVVCIRNDAANALIRQWNKIQVDSESLADVMLAALEANCRSGDAAGIERILKLDQMCKELPPNAASAYARIARWIGTAQRERVSNAPAARQALIQVLQETDSEGAIDFAVERLKSSQKQ